MDDTIREIREILEVEPTPEQAGKLACVLDKLAKNYYHMGSDDGYSCLGDGYYVDLP